MNANTLLDAMNNIHDSYVLSAMNKICTDLGDTEMTNSVGHIRFRRSISLVAAVIMILMASLITVMAVDSGFRTNVFAFLGIQNAEIVTGPTDMESHPDDMAMIGFPVKIGDVIEASYIQFPALSHASSGLFFVCDDAIQMNSGNRYTAYYEKSGSFVRLESHRFDKIYHVLGNDIHLYFEWVEHNGTVAITYTDPDAPFAKPKLSGVTSAALFSLLIDLPDGSGYTDYPVLINLNTGELMDVCAGTGVDQISGICQSAISEDLTKMLLADNHHNLYYVDLISKTTYSLDQLSGQHVDECAFVGDSLVCWSLEGDSIETASLGNYSAWLIDLSCLERKDLFQEIPATAQTSYDVWSETYYLAQENPEAWSSFENGQLPPLSSAGLQFIDGFSATWHAGAMFTGSTFAVITDADRSAYVIDLASGEKSKIEGFLWPEGDPAKTECIPSADGNKLLICTRGADRYYDSIGVLDFEEKTFFIFSRENVSGRNERAVYWFDNDSVIVETSDSENMKNYYLYRIR